MRYLLARLSEPSSWRGLTWIATAAGIGVAPELMNHIVVAGSALAGLIGFLFKDSTPPGSELK